MRFNFKKVAPFLIGAVMLTSTAAFALAADLSEYPAPFVSGGAADVSIIYGEDAMAIDMAATALINGDLATALASQTAGGITTAVTGGVSKEIPINKSLNDGTYGWSSGLDDSDLAGLQDGEISIDIGDVSDDYSFHDKINFGAGARIQTGLSSSAPDDDFKDNVFLELGRGDIYYNYTFDESLKNGNYIRNVSADEPITLKLMGRSIEIRSCADNDTITALVGAEVTLAVGETMTAGGKTVTLVNVGSGGAIVVDVDGVEDMISAGNTKKINGVRVKNDETFYSNTLSERQATIIAGDDTTKTYDSGDAYIGQDEDDPDWVWELDYLDGNKPLVGIVFDQSWKDDDEVIYVGKSFEMPGGFKVSLTGLTEGLWQDYVIEKVETELKNSTGGILGNLTMPVSEGDVNALRVKSLGGTQDGIKIGSHETDIIYLYAGKNESGTDLNVTGVYWYDHDDAGGSPKFWKRLTNSTAGAGGAENVTTNLQFKDTTIGLNMNFGGSDSGTGGSNDTITDFVYLGINATNQNVQLRANVSTTDGVSWFGIADGDSIEGDVIVGLASGDKNIGTWKENTLTSDGIKIYDPDEYGDSDKFKFSIPSDETNDFEVIVAVTGPGGIASTATGVTALGDVILTDKEAEASQPATNLIVVGDSAVNRVALKIADPTKTYPVKGAGLTELYGYAENQALLKFYTSPYSTDKVALLVAGWEGDDTKAAGKALIARGLSGESKLLSKGVDYT